METLIAYCGLRCDSCPIHLATLEPDQTRQRNMRESIAEQCTALYGINIRPKDVTNCDGCRANTGRLFSGCLTCEIRKCAGMKPIENCAYCSDYPCGRLTEFFSVAPEAQIQLEKIRLSAGDILYKQK